MIATLVWGNLGWLPVAAVILAVLLVALWSGYRRAPVRPTLRLVAVALKILAVAALAACLVEPLWQGVRPRPGANLFLLLVDNSQSMRVPSDVQEPPHLTQLRDELRAEQLWQTRLAQDFDVRRYAFDSRFNSLTDERQLSFAGNQSALGETLGALTRQYAQRPLAGILVFTDGNATDDLPRHSTVPIYPVVVQSDDSAAVHDVRIERVTVSETNFQSAPVTVLATVGADGLAGRTVAVQLLDEAGSLIEQQSWKPEGDSTGQIQFRFRPRQSSLTFCQVQACLERELDSARPATLPQRTREVTLANNRRLAVVNQVHGPYRILYVSGRPNWEFKFLRRALARDAEVALVGLVRIANREPKFTFRGRAGEASNPLFRGFDPDVPEEVERYDQPVLLRVGIESKDELRDGFPKLAADLFRYDAIILDDLEADFFSADQMSLLQKFVSERGGGLLMLGGAESFGAGRYRRTLLEDLLPIYLPAAAAPLDDTRDLEAAYRLGLTREGWLQPWVRLRGTEEEEHRRLESMPAFRTRNRSGAPKPGASVLLQARDAQGRDTPALVTQRYGRGRSGALLIGDMWRWRLRADATQQQDDSEYQWVQTVRWLVSDGPRRVEVEQRRRQDEPGQPVEMQITVRDAQFRPLENAAVRVRVATPPGGTLELTTEPSAEKPGVYQLRYVPRDEGAYRAVVEATTPDGEKLEPRSIGWVHEPAVEELRALRPDVATLERLARESGGEVLRLNELERFSASLPNRAVPVTEPWTYPLWHRGSIFALAIVCLAAEWGLRRWRGLP